MKNASGFWPGGPGRALSFAVVSGAAAFFVATSWRKWTEPLVDFGRELYIPWRISHGALLYRDVDDFYGPLSQYLNAALFRLFGPGLMVLAAANLAIGAVTVFLLHALFLRAWGRIAALAATVVFIAVFGCSVSVWANFNFVTPYSHEATHGFLACVALVLALGRWIRQPGPARAALAGLLFGLTAVLKPEIMLAAGCATAAAAVVGPRGRVLVPSSLAWAAAAAAPTLGFWGYFAARVPARQALGFACRAWLNAVGPDRLVDRVLQGSYLGFDQAGPHLLDHMRATALAILLFAGLAAGSKAVDRIARAPLAVLAGLALACGCAWLAWAEIAWGETGRCLAGLSLAYLVFSAFSYSRELREGGDGPRQALRLMTSILALSLLARMILNGRINHFGFYQAALAGILVPAVLIGELPSRMQLGARGRITLVSLVILLFGIGTARIAARSQAFLRQRTFAVGDGADRFYTLPPEVEATGALVRHFSEELRAKGGNQTLLVLPEGEMINYLARMPSPAAPFFFFSVATQGQREHELREELARHPPDWIVVISRDLREYGVGRYGDAEGQGKELLEWSRSDFVLVDSLGGDPLDYRQRGGVLLRFDPARRAAP